MLKLFTTLLIWTSSVSALAGTILLNFSEPVNGSLTDANGNGTGFECRLPGTGTAYPTNDPQLTLLQADGILCLTSAWADINQAPGTVGVRLPYMVMPALQVHDVGQHDMEIKALFRNVSVPNLSDQLGVYIGIDQNKVMRAGIHQGNFYIVSENKGTGDLNTHTIPWRFNAGDDIELALVRQDMVWYLTWANLTSNDAGFIYVSPQWLKPYDDFYVGVYAANARNLIPFNANLDYFQVTTPESNASTTCLIGAVGFFGLYRQIKRKRMGANLC